VVAGILIAFVCCWRVENEMHEIDVQGDCCTRELGKIGVRRLERSLLLSPSLHELSMTSSFTFLPNVTSLVTLQTIYCHATDSVVALDPEKLQING